ncbi:MAG: DUF1269 domain-containing protein [Candidatus Competibacteraceae bacterium]|nr:DUF1269 domain-containing protein [Candidatus Competibacteraceae bacterium]
MRRLYLLIPDPERARALVVDLRDNGVGDEQLHLVAKDHHRVEEVAAHEATLLQRSEFLPAVERGAAAGGATGLLAGIAAVTFPPAGLVLGGGAILGMGLIGAGLGAWIAGTQGENLSDYQIEEFEQAIEEGQILLLIDVPAERAEEVIELVKYHQNQWERELTGRSGPT